MWPGYGENLRVLKWIVDRVQGRCVGIESPLGVMPRHQDIHWEGLEFDPQTFYKLMSVDVENAKQEATSHEELFDKFYDRLPKEFVHHRELLKSRLWRSPSVWRLENAIF
jgi:phosphoenolpyruvate carboxykinase (GTP)